MYPMVRARITAINSKPSESLKFKGDSARGYLEREQNLTWASRLMDDNQLIAGHWWTAADYGKPLVSISSEYKEALQLELGDTLSFDIAGEELTVRVASIRKVRWDSFRPNFFLVFPPGLLEGTAGTYMTSVYLTPAQRPALVDLVRQFPTVSVFDVDAILRQIRAIIDRASLAVQYVFLFTLTAGIVVLLAAVQSTRDERRYESAMLRTLGASRRTVLQGVAAEFSALGLSLRRIGRLRRQRHRLDIGAPLVRAAVHLRSLGVGARLGVRNDIGGGERHSGHAAGRQYAAHRHLARRVASVTALRGSANLRGSEWPRGGRASMRTVYIPAAIPVVLIVSRNSLFESFSTLFRIKARP